MYDEICATVWKKCICIMIYSMQIKFFLVILTKRHTAMPLCTHIFIDILYKNIQFIGN